MKHIQPSLTAIFFSKYFKNREVMVLWTSYCSLKEVSILYDFCSVFEIQFPEMGWRRLLLRPGHLWCTYGRSGRFPEGGRSIVLRQLLLWWLNSPWAPGHICGVSVMLVVVVVLLFSVLVQGLTR